MKKVLLNYGDYVAYADDLDSGLADLLKQAQTGVPTTEPPTTTNPSPPTGSDALTAAVVKIDKALADLKAAQASGDFTKYGQALSELQAATAEYDKARAALGKGTVSPSPTSPGG